MTQTSEKLFQSIKKDAQSGGYFLNPDDKFVMELVDGLLVNEQRYGYRSCPCRLTSGKKETDLDIICPCDYRDSDVEKYGACYCALYVSKEVLNGKKKLTSIPESRKKTVETNEGQKTRNENELTSIKTNILELTFPVYRCKVCGYLCARENPPEICPICKVPKERFERFI